MIRSLRRVCVVLSVVGAFGITGAGMASADTTVGTSCGDFCHVTGSACTVTHIGNVTVLSGDCKS